MQERNFLFHQLKGLLCAVAVGILLISCQQSNEESNGVSIVKPANIVGGPGEKTFAEKYDLTVTLPTPESSFLEILKRLNLQYEVYGKRGSAGMIPTPRKPALVDIDNIQKVYQIYGEVNREKGTGEMYWAYVDMEHQVVYIENRFSYTGP